MPLERFDGAALWTQLSSDSQAEIGAIALEIVAAWNCQDRQYHYGLDPKFERMGMEANSLLIEELQVAFVSAFERETLQGADGLPLFPSVLGPVCRECGCSEMDACDEGCGWAEPDLCTACAPVAAASDAAEATP